MGYGQRLAGMRDTKAVTLGLLDRLYACVAGDGGWSGFLAALALALEAIVPGLFVLGVPGDVPVLVEQEALDPKWQEAFDSHYVKLDVRRPLIQQLEEGSTFRGQDVISDREFTRREFYNDFLKPQGLFHIAGGVFLKERGRIGVIRVLRARGARRFGVQERGVLEGLLPHLKRAVAVQDRLAELSEGQRISETLLDRWTTGAILLDENGRVMWANERARSLVRGGEGLHLDRRGCIVAAHPEDDCVLRRLVATAAAEGETDVGGGALTLRRPGGRRPLSAMVTPIRAVNGLATSPSARVALLVTDPDAEVLKPVVAVQRHLGITPAEARLALALGQGRSVAQAALELGISEATARTQVKSILAKTGTHRQTELVKLLLSAPVILT
jgi:DNA-binding CsgD family transcriptional regulator